MADVDQFILAITNEAMDRACYETTAGDGGWILSPYQFAISDTDPLAGYSDDQIFNEDGSVKPEIYELLQKMTTQDLRDDERKIWCQLPFSGVTKVSNPGDTLSHLVAIPADHPIVGESKQIKTIYFIYTDNRGLQFLYAIARANADLVYEAGLAQKYFFNFTVANKYEMDATEFVVNYSYPLEIQSHNNSPDAHDMLVDRAGTRSITGLLNYITNHSAITTGNTIVDKDYVDTVLAALRRDLIEMMSDLTAVAIPPGTLYWWPGLINTIPQGWTIRDGRLLTIADNPKLYQLFDNGQRYRQEYLNSHSSDYDTSKYFPIMDDRALFIRGCETNGTSVTNNNYLSGVEFGQKQNTALPNLKGKFSGHNTSDGTLFKHSSSTQWHGNRNDNGQKRTVTFNANSYNNIYQDGVKEARPMNRNYLPIIKLG